MIEFSQVKRMAADRDCRALRATKRGCEIVGRRCEWCVANGGDGLWLSREVMRACTAARWDPARVIKRRDPPDGLDYNHGLDEREIAEILADDGIRSYHGRRRTIALEAILRANPDRPTIELADSNANVQRAAKAVRDAGYAELTMGPRSGWSRASLAWNAVAVRPAKRIETTAEDEEVLRLIGR